MSNGAPFTIWLWIIGLSALYVGPPVLIVGSAVWISTRRARRGQGGQDSRNGSGGRAAHHARVGRLGGLLAGALAGAVAFLAGFGLLAPIVVAVGFLVGVLITELRPSRPTGPIRVASLQARSAWQYLPPWVVPAIVATAALALVAPILFIAVPPPADMQNGWMIAVSLPLALIVVIALAGLVLLMARVAALPQDQSGARTNSAGTNSAGTNSAGTNSAGTNSAGTNRANTARAIAGAVLGIELLALGAMAIVASSDVASPFAHAGVAYLSSRILIWSGLGLAVAGMLAWAMLSRWRPVSAAPPEPVDPGGTGLGGPGMAGAGSGDAGSPRSATPRVA
jgi:hypothetical protein